MRLNRFLAMKGIAARRKCETLLSNGKITVNNVVVTNPAYQVNIEHDDVRLEGKPLQYSSPIYIMVNKPPKIVTTVKDEKGRTTILDLVSISQRIFPVGRLDYDVCGLILLTNDGELTYRLTHPKFRVQKTYEVVLDKTCADSDIKRLKAGVMIGPGEKVIPDAVELRKWGDGTVLQITVHEGKKHEIKRIVQSLGYRVRKLQRIAFAGIHLRQLPLGAWRHLSKKEVQALKKMAGMA